MSQAAPMIKWILVDQAKVQTHLLFSNKKTYVLNGKEHSASSLEHIFWTPDHKAYNKGEISESEFVDRFIASEKLDVTRAQFIEALKSSIVPIPGMHAILSRLKTHYRLVAVINEGKEWTKYKLDISGFTKLFEKVFCSGEMGIVKPDLRFYEHILKELSAKPEECLFIDDDEKNCLAASTFKMETILFKDVGQLEKELEKKGILGFSSKKPRAN